MIRTLRWLLENLYLVAILLLVAIWYYGSQERYPGDRAMVKVTLPLQAAEARQVTQPSQDAESGQRDAHGSLYGANLAPAALLPVMVATSSLTPAEAWPDQATDLLPGAGLIPVTTSAQQGQSVAAEVDRADLLPQADLPVESMNPAEAAVATDMASKGEHNATIGEQEVNEIAPGQGEDTPQASASEVVTADSNSVTSDGVVNELSAVTTMQEGAAIQTQAAEAGQVTQAVVDEAEIASLPLAGGQDRSSDEVAAAGDDSSLVMTEEPSQEAAVDAPSVDEGAALTITTAISATADRDEGVSAASPIAPAPVEAVANGGSQPGESFVAEEAREATEPATGLNVVEQSDSSDALAEETTPADSAPKVEMTDVAASILLPLEQPVELDGVDELPPSRDIAIEPPWALWYQAREAAMAGDTSLALDRYRALAMILPDNADVFGETGNILYWRQEYAGAVEHYSRAVRIYIQAGNHARAWRLSLIVANLSPEAGRRLQLEMLPMRGYPAPYQWR
jgi:hypothetical protein